MKGNGYVGRAFTKYVALPVLGLTMCAMAAKANYGTVHHEAMPDIDGDGIPEVVSSINGVLDTATFERGSKLYVLTSGMDEHVIDFDDPILDFKYANGNLYAKKQGKPGHQNVFYRMERTRSGFTKPVRIGRREYRKGI